jgi:hypothetical protein
MLGINHFQRVLEAQHALASINIHSNHISAYKLTSFANNPVPVWHEMCFCILHSPTNPNLTTT